MGAIVNSNLMIENFINLFVKILQFFFIYFIIVQINDNERILDNLYKLSIALSVLSIIFFVIRVKGYTLPHFVINFSVSYPVIYYYFPFGFERFSFISTYRAYSYFLEPAKYAFFLSPFLFYSIYKWEFTKKKIHLLFLIILLVSLMLTQSLGAIVSLTISTTIIMFYYFIIVNINKKVKYSLYILILLVLICFAAISIIKGIDTSSYIIKRSETVIDRLSQLSFLLKNLPAFILGRGYGDRAVIFYINPYTNIEGETGLTSFYYEYLYSFGLLSIITLLYFILFILKNIVKLFKSNSIFRRTTAYMILTLLIYNFSINLIFVGYFLILLVIFFLEVDKEKANQSMN